MIAALLLPRLLDRISDRRLMITAALAMALFLGMLAAAWSLTDPAQRWLVAYPLAGQVGAGWGMGTALAASAALAVAGTLLAILIWPGEDPDAVPHNHDDLPADHPHMVESHANGEATHAYVIDELHPSWP